MCVSVIFSYVLGCMCVRSASDAITNGTFPPVQWHPCLIRHQTCLISDEHSTENMLLYYTSRNYKKILMMNMQILTAFAYLFNRTKYIEMLDRIF